MSQPRVFFLAPFLLALLLAACGTVPKPPATPDVPAAKRSADIAKTPDATPQIEPVREGGPNKPYALGGRSYTPQTGDKPFTERGIASWYGKPFHGRRTASGEVYNMFAMSAAHKTLAIPSYARVRNPANGREVIVRVNDRGPFHKGRVIDLSYAAAMKLGVTNGLATVEVERITYEDIRTGAWKKEGLPTAQPELAAPDVAEVAASGTEAPAPPGAPQALPIDASTPPALSVAMADAPEASPASRAFTTAAQGFWLQLGAFRQRAGAEQLHRQVADELNWLSPLLAVFSEAQMFRLQAGPYPTRAEAQQAASRVNASLKLSPMVVERR